jgi:hypothetical protein
MAGKHGWSPSPNDAMSLAAIRWFACNLESLAIDIYATDRTKFKEIETALNTALRAISGINVNRPIGAEDCPEGYALCNGLCRPACLEDATVTARGGRPSKAKKRR